MAGHFIPFNGGIAHISRPDIYRYHGVTFEFHRYCGPMLLKKDGEPSLRNPGRKFFKMFDAWDRLPPSKKKRTLIFS